MVVQFSGEDNWDAIVNDNSLDIEEEYQFEQYVLQNGRDRDAPLEELEQLFEGWNASTGL